MQKQSFYMVIISQYSYFVYIFALNAALVILFLNNLKYTLTTLLMLTYININVFITY